MTKIAPRIQAARPMMKDKSSGFMRSFVFGNRIMGKYGVRRNGFNLPALFLLKLLKENEAGGVTITNRITNHRHSIRLHLNLSYYGRLILQKDNFGGKGEAAHLQALLPSESRVPEVPVDTLLKPESLVRGYGRLPYLQSLGVRRMLPRASVVMAHPYLTKLERKSESRREPISASEIGMMSHDQYSSPVADPPRKAQGIRLFSRRPLEEMALADDAAGRSMGHEHIVPLALEGNERPAKGMGWPTYPVQTAHSFRVELFSHQGVQGENRFLEAEGDGKRTFSEQGQSSRVSVPPSGFGMTSHDMNSPAMAFPPRKAGNIALFSRQPLKKTGSADNAVGRSMVCGHSVTLALGYYERLAQGISLPPYTTILVPILEQSVPSSRFKPFSRQGKNSFPVTEGGGKRTSSEQGQAAQAVTRSLGDSPRENQKDNTGSAIPLPLSPERTRNSSELHSLETSQIAMPYAPIARYRHPVPQARMLHQRKGFSSPTIELPGRAEKNSVRKKASYPAGNSATPVSDIVHRRLAIPNYRFVTVNRSGDGGSAGQDAHGSFRSGFAPEQPLEMAGTRFENDIIRRANTDGSVRQPVKPETTVSAIRLTTPLPTIIQRTGAMTGIRLAPVSANLLLQANPRETATGENGAVGIRPRGNGSRSTPGSDSGRGTPLVHKRPLPGSAAVHNPAAGLPITTTEATNSSQQTNLTVTQTTPQGATDTIMFNNPAGTAQQPAASGQQLNVPPMEVKRIANDVYKMIEKKLMIERERRGL